MWNLKQIKGDPSLLKVLRMNPFRFEPEHVLDIETKFELG